MEQFIIETINRLRAIQPGEWMLIAACLALTLCLWKIIGEPLLGWLHRDTWL